MFVQQVYIYIYIYIYIAGEQIKWLIRMMQKNELGNISKPITLS
jgi:hypothetical protein